MIDAVFFWTIFGLVILGLLFSCFILCYLPSISDKVELSDWYKISKDIEETEDLNVVSISDQPNKQTRNHLGSLFSNPQQQRSNQMKRHNPLPSQRGNSIMNKTVNSVLFMSPATTNNNTTPTPTVHQHDTKNKDNHIAPPLDDKKSLSVSIKKINQIKDIIVTTFWFKTILYFALLFSIIIYPPSLWYAWDFFPSNSSVVLSLLFCGMALSLNTLIILIIPMVCDKWIYIFKHGFHISDSALQTAPNSPKKKIISTEYYYQFKQDIRWILLAPTMWVGWLFTYLLLRLLFIWIGSSITLYDGWVLLSILGFIELLFFIFPFTLL